MNKLGQRQFCPNDRKATTDIHPVHAAVVSELIGILCLASEDHAS